MVKTADGREVLVRQALFSTPTKTPHWAGLVRITGITKVYSDTVILNGDRLVVIADFPTSVNTE